MSPRKVGAFILKTKGSPVARTGPAIFLTLGAFWNCLVALWTLLAQDLEPYFGGY